MRGKVLRFFCGYFEYILLHTSVAEPGGTAVDVRNDAGDDICIAYLTTRIGHNIGLQAPYQSANDRHRHAWYYPYMLGTPPCTTTRIGHNIGLQAQHPIVMYTK